MRRTDRWIDPFLFFFFVFFVQFVVCLLFAVFVVPSVFLFVVFAAKLTQIWA